MAEHWFDDLNRALVRPAPRRSAAQAVVALTALFLHDGLSADAGKKKRKRKKRRRGNRPDRASCSEGACQRAFRKGKDRNHCEFICTQCDGDDPREFCIITSAGADPTKIAVCCDPEYECCAGRCCGPDPLTPGHRCCGGRCVDTLRDIHNCGQCGRRCPAGHSCVDGVCLCREDRCPCAGTCTPQLPDCCQGQCVNKQTDRNNCRDCGQTCPDSPGWDCCRGSCRDTLSNESACGSCDIACATGQRCCNGICADLDTDPTNCGSCGRACDLGHECCNGICFDPGTAICCQEFSPCPTDGNSVCCETFPFCRSAFNGCAD